MDRSGQAPAAAWRVRARASAAHRWKRSGITAGLWFLLVVSSSAQAPPSADEAAGSSPEADVTWGGEVEVRSQYVWRGFRYSEGVVVWPSAWIAARGVSASLSFNYDPDSDPTWNEFDLAFSYERSVGPFTLTGTYSRYTYYDGASSDATSEVIGQADLAVGPGVLFTTHAVDIERFKGSYYAEFGYAIERQLGRRLSLSADASIALWRRFLDRYTRDMATHITDGKVGPIMLNVSVLQAFARGLAVRPAVTFLVIGDARARRVLDPPALTASVALVFDR